MDGERLRMLGMLVLVLGFTAVEWTFGPRVAVVLGALYAVGEAGWSAWRDGRPSTTSLVLLALVVGLGWMAWMDEDGELAMLSPAIGDVAMAAMGLGAHVLGRPILLAALDAQQPDLDLSPGERRYLSAMGLRLIGSLLGHALLVVVAVERWPDWALTVGGIGQLVWLGGHLGLEVLYARYLERPSTS